MIKIQDTLERSSNLHVANVAGMTIILDSSKINILGFNETGDYIFNYINEPVKVEKLVNHLSDVFSIDNKQCFTDIRTFLEKMVVEKVLKISTVEESKDPRSAISFDTRYLDWEVPILTK